MSDHDRKLTDEEHLRLVLALNKLLREQKFTPPQTGPEMPEPEGEEFKMHPTLEENMNRIFGQAQAELDAEGDD